MEIIRTYTESNLHLHFLQPQSVIKLGYCRACKYGPTLHEASTFKAFFCEIILIEICFEAVFNFKSTCLQPFVQSHAHFNYEIELNKRQKFPLKIRFSKAVTVSCMRRAKNIKVKLTNLMNSKI